MVTTRSQSNRDNRIERTEMDTFSDDDDNISVADLYSRNLQENNEEAMHSQERYHERHRIKPKFLDMNRQIGELTSMVRARTEKISNGREENGQNVRNIEMSLRSDREQSICDFCS